MADSTPDLSANFRDKVIKAGALRLSDATARDTTDYAEILVVDGVPSGGYGRHSGASLVAIRKDASGVDVVLYVSPDGGTTWNAVESSGLGSDAELTAIAGLTSAANKIIRFTGSGTAELIDCTSAGAALLDDADATAQRVTLGLVIGTNVQAYDASLLSLAALATAADRFPYTTGIDTYAEATITAAGRAILDDADAAAQRTTLGLASLDTWVKAVIAVPNVGSGGTDAALTLQLNQADGSTAIGSARQVLIIATSAQYQPNPPLTNTVTFATATTGTLVSSGNGWALVETSAAGAFACTAADSADETVWFRVVTAEAGSDLAKACVVIPSLPDSAAWSA